MKIAIINKFFYLKGGQETVALEEMQMLEKAGHAVAFFSMKHPNNPQNYAWEKYFADYVEFSDCGREYNFGQKIKIAKNFIYNSKAAKNFEEFIKEFKPDIIHCHGIAHQITYSVLPVAKKHNIPVIQTLHDCQTVCPNYTLLLGGKEICPQKCTKYNYIPCITNKCVKNSFSASVLAAVEMYFNRNILNYTQYIHKFITPSRFLADTVIKSGIADNKLNIISNCLADIEKTQPNYSNKGYFLFAGRLSFEKGILTAVKAFKDLPEHKLLIAGTGPLEEELKKYIQENNMRNVEFLGFVGRGKLPEYIRESIGVIISSVCYENQPMSAIEAFAHGKPVIGTAIGGIPELVINDYTGYTFSIGNLKELQESITKMATDSEKLKILGQNAYNFAQERFTSDKHINSLLKLYEELTGK